ncbi:MAG: FG-GAP repeat domain-containing protein [Candidatus Hydrogenedentota bacterium]
MLLRYCFLSCAAALLMRSAGATAETFQFGPAFRVGPQPRDIVAPDLDGDGWPEIITADCGAMVDRHEERPANDELSMLRAEGDLDYVKHHPSLKTGFAPYCIAIANIDAIKMPDIVVASFLAARNRDLSLYRNLPEGIFETLRFRVPDEGLDYYRHTDGDGLPIFTQPGLTALAIRDMDGDGYRDVIATGWSSDVLVYFPGEDGEYFGNPTLIPCEGGPRDVAVHDFDGDGIDDLAVVLHATGEVALWKGDGEGRFTEETRFSTRGRLPTTLRIADVNGDGKADICVSHSHTDDSVAVFYGDGKFRFSVSQELLVGEHRDVLEEGIHDLVAADLTGNDRVDLAVACFAALRVVVYVNTSEDVNRPQSFSREEYTFREGRPRALCTADFNQDGKPDLAVAQWEPDAVQLLLGR